jgi:hypothetical protein
LPRNFDKVHAKNELVHESTVPTIRTLWRQADVEETRLENSGETYPYVHEKSVDWVSPVIFVSFLLLSQNPAAVTIALGVISNYLTDFFKGRIKNPRVKFDLVVEKNREGMCRKIHFEGDLEGLAKIPEIVKEARRDE